jgi:hypothetical protein
MRGPMLFRSLSFVILAAFVNIQASTEIDELKKLKNECLSYKVITVPDHQDGDQYEVTRFERKDGSIDYFEQSLKNPKSIMHCYRRFKSVDQDGTHHYSYMLTASPSYIATESPSDSVTPEDRFLLFETMFLAIEFRDQVKKWVSESKKRESRENYPWGDYYPKFDV